MSDEYNRYDLGNDPEEKSETPETTAAQETMETAEAVDTETAATTENTESVENTSYAFSYRKAGSKYSEPLQLLPFFFPDSPGTREESKK